MSIHLATPKQTSGAGFSFEDKVVAYYLVWMLTGEAPFRRIHGAIERIDCQVQVDGWRLDDLLLTLSQNSHQHRYAFSIKSNVQFTASSAPFDFVQMAWSLLLQEGSSSFSTDSYMMGLISPPQPEPARRAILSLLT